MAVQQTSFSTFGVLLNNGTLFMCRLDIRLHDNFLLAGWVVCLDNPQC